MHPTSLMNTISTSVCIGIVLVSSVWSVGPRSCSEQVSMSVAPSTDVMLLLLSAIVHALHYCATDECESDDDEPSTMYSEIHPCMPGLVVQNYATYP
eukprot:COSAG06_NODE_27481_length_592_cov_1.139959_1_plen_96_part_10